MKMLWLAAILSLAIGASVVRSATKAGDPPASGVADKGKVLFLQCVACHGRDGGGTALAPSLKDVVGRKAAIEEDFAYSGALKRSGKVWTDNELSAFLLKPQVAVPGTRMAYAGAGSPADAEALVAYLKMLH